MSATESQNQIDFDHLNQYVGGDPELTLEVFGLFRNQVDMWAKMLDPKATDDQWAAITHSLKGSARAVGAMKLANLCEQCETFIGDDNRPGARDVAVGKLEASISQVLTEIGRWEYKYNIAKLKA